MRCKGLEGFISFWCLPRLGGVCGFGLGAGLVAWGLIVRDRRHGFFKGLCVMINQYEALGRTSVGRQGRTRQMGMKEYWVIK